MFDPNKSSKANDADIYLVLRKMPLLTWFKLSQAWLSKKYEYITYPFSTFNNETINVWEWIRNLNHTLPGMWLLIHTGIEINLYQ